MNTGNHLLKMKQHLKYARNAAGAAAAGTSTTTTTTATAFDVKTLIRALKNSVITSLTELANCRKASA